MVDLIDYRPSPIWEKVGDEGLCLKSDSRQRLCRLMCGSALRFRYGSQ